jgi:hypothetical protein
MSSSGTEMSRDELGATLAARNELGKDYEPAIVDALAERVEQVVQARVAAQLAQARQPPPMTQGPMPTSPSVLSGWARGAVAITSLGIAIPATAVAGDVAGLAGVVVCWAGIAIVNLAAAVNARPPGWR